MSNSAILRFLLRHRACNYAFGLLLASPLSSKVAIASDDWTAAFERLSARAAAIVDLTASFEEHKFTTMMKAPLVTKGRVRILGERSRWDTQSPDEMVMTVDSQEVRLFYPDRNVVEILPIDARLQSLVVSPLFRLSTLREHFEIVPLPGEEPREDEPAKPGSSEERLGEDGLALTLIPREPLMREFVERIRIIFDTRAGCVRMLEMSHQDGDRTVLHFLNVQVNTGLTEADVTLSIPSGAKIHRVPMGNR